MLTKLLLGGGAALAFATAAFAQGPGAANAQALAMYQSMATSTPQSVGEYARSAPGVVINDMPNYNSIAFSRAWNNRGTGYNEPIAPPPAELAPAAR